eukprot:3682198-Pleurochrysis_carterae.AAC.1
MRAIHHFSPEEPPDTSSARAHVRRLSYPFSDAITPSPHSTRSAFIRCASHRPAVSRHMNDIARRSPACLRVRALLPRTRAL